MAADGLNLLVGGGSESTSLPAFRGLPCDPKRSFRAVIRPTRQPLLVVARRAGRHADLGEAVEAAKRVAAPYYSFVHSPELRAQPGQARGVRPIAPRAAGF